MSPDLLTPSGPFTTALAPSLNQWSKASARMGPLARALQVSRDRAGGAAKAGDRTWERRQMQAVAKYAAQLASALRSLSSTQQAFAAALAGAGATGFDVPADKAAQFVSSVRRNGLPAGLKSTVRKDGLTSAEIAAVAKRIVSSGAGKLVLGLDDTVADPRNAQAYNDQAAFLAAYAKRVAANPSTKQN